MAGDGTGGAGDEGDSPVIGSVGMEGEEAIQRSDDRPERVSRAAK
jgi:hypothetical protein